MVLFMDWSFASGSSRPRLSTTQLPSATDRPVLLSDGDFHPTVGAYSQAHIFPALRAFPAGDVLATGHILFSRISYLSLLAGSPSFS
jgi:hypothetical protein